MSTDSAAFYRKAPPDKGASSFVYPPTGPNLAFFAQALQAGCVVAIPTETVYGLAGLALDEGACRAIFSIKGRPLLDPLIIHVSGAAMAAQLAELPDRFFALAEAFWPGPLTLIVKKKPLVPDIVTAGKDTVAIRMPRHPVTHALLEQVGAPLAAPSANPFGYVSPSKAEHVADSFAGKVPFVLDGGPCEIGLESTILDITQPEQAVILRPGAVTAEAIGAILGTPVEVRLSTVDSGTAATAPGTMAHHYSPKIPLFLFAEGSMPPARPDQAVLWLQRPNRQSPAANEYWLSEDGDPAQVARSLFALLRQLDRAGFASMACELPAPGSSGLAEAIRDRLTRAAAQK